LHPQYPELKQTERMQHIAALVSVNPSPLSIESTPSKHESTPSQHESTPCEHESTPCEVDIAALVSDDCVTLVLLL
jgi:hypothetical protein